jgi:succinyl-diaminopimelate desuccinylase
MLQHLARGFFAGRRVYEVACGTGYWTQYAAHDKGRLTLTAVSDEETFGPWGARYLMAHHPEVLGDCCLNGEPSSPFSIRFGEKGPLWLKFTVRTAGAHGAYTHVSESASKIGVRLAADLERLSDLNIALPDKVTALLDRAAATIDQARVPVPPDFAAHHRQYWHVFMPG